MPSSLRCLCVVLVVLVMPALVVLVVPALAVVAVARFGGGVETGEGARKEMQR
jgi:hypothetical protein